MEKRKPTHSIIAAIIITVFLFVFSSCSYNVLEPIYEYNDFPVLPDRIFNVDEAM